MSYPLDHGAKTTILGIEPTKDKKAITKAYRGKLAQVNPEDRPEEFKALRGAYEEALKLADKDNEGKNLPSFLMVFTRFCTA